ncbi:hypothetical protein A5626_15605 [Mycobacterium marseillense]|nr:hypothetical protein A5626_15605 [Mycobacterium marseillense]
MTWVIVAIAVLVAVLAGRRRRGARGGRPRSRRGVAGRGSGGLGGGRRRAAGLGGRCRRFAVAAGLVDRVVEGRVERLVASLGVPWRGGLGRAPGGLRGGLRRAFSSGLAAPEGLAQAASDRRFYRRRCGFDEFALIIQPGEDFLTGDTEFLSQLVYAGLTCHYISCL